MNLDAATADFARAAANLMAAQVAATAGAGATNGGQLGAAAGDDHPFVRKAPDSPTNDDLAEKLRKAPYRPFDTDDLMTLWKGYNRAEASTPGTKSHKQRNRLSARMPQVARKLATELDADGNTFQLYKFYKADKARLRADGKANRVMRYWTKPVKGKAHPKILRGSPGKVEVQDA